MIQQLKLHLQANLNIINIVKVGFVITTIATKTGANIAKKTVLTTSFKEVNGGYTFSVGGNTIATEYASQLIVNLLANATGTVELTSICSNTPKTLNTKNDHLNLTDGTDYRIMTLNMLWYSSYTDTSRDEKRIEFINYYSPDVIGFQECCTENMTRFMPLLKAQGYTVIQQEVYAHSYYATNCVPIAYKTSKFACIEKGWKRLPGENDYYGITWAVLKDKTTSKTFAVTSSHFYNSIFVRLMQRTNLW